MQKLKHSETKNYQKPAKCMTLTHQKQLYWKTRRNCCPYCLRVVTNFSRHIVKFHKTEEEVQNYMSILDEDLKERKRKRCNITDQLRKKGNHFYNLKIVNKEVEGELMPIRRPAKKFCEVTAFTHVTCTFCLGLYKKENLYLHFRNCDQNPYPSNSNSNNNDDICDGTVAGKQMRNRVLKGASQMLIPESSLALASAQLQNNVFNSMVKDKISLIAQSDPLIVSFGTRFYNHHRDDHQRSYTSAKMRDLSRILLAMKEKNADIEYLEDCLLPSMFDDLVEVVRNVSEFNEETGEVGVPSFAPRVCSSLKSCAEIKKSLAVKDNSYLTPEKNKIRKSVDDFLHLMATEWKIEVSSNAEKTRKKKKVEKIDILPNDDDIRLFCSSLSTGYGSLVENLCKNPSPANYEALAKDLIAHIIVLSRRRPGEVVNAKMVHYEAVLQNDTITQMKEYVLTDEERRCGEELSIFHVPGKNTRKVPIILTKSMRSALDALTASRHEIQIESPLLFARPDSDATYDGTKVLESVKKRFALTNPEHFTATGLRHHAATSSQLYERNDTFTENLATFLGHDVNIHKSNYKLPLALIQKSQVGHRLLKMTIPDEDQKFRDRHLSQYDPEQDTGQQCKNKNDETDLPEELSDSESLPSNKSAPKLKNINRIRWTEEEKEVLYKHFGKYFIRNEAPERKTIIKVYENEPALSRRTIQQLCTYVNNIVKGKTKIPSPVVRKIKSMMNK